MPSKKSVKSRRVPIELLTRRSFFSFGHVIENPTPPYVSAGCYDPSFKPYSANQGTALKYSNISPLINNYDVASKQVAAATMSLFVCSPRPLPPGLALLDLNILERHPYTTQTFSPLGLGDDSDTTYIVVAAPTINPSEPDAGSPDTSNVRAFLARGNQAVTYGPGTWHAPMIVIGNHDVPFVVTQFVNGVPEDDCQEIELECQGGGLKIDVSGWRFIRDALLAKAKL